MLTFTFLAVFLPACFALNIAPGPNNLLAFSTASRLGFGRALLGGLGRLPAFAAMIALVALGLGAVLAASELAFGIVRYLGAAYLIYVGWSMWRSPARAASGLHRAESTRALMRRDFLIALGNPKAIAVFTAFFPQFVDFTQPLNGQFLILGAIFLGMELVAVVIYCALGRGLSSFLTPFRLHLLNKGVGGLLIASGAGMALSPKN